MDKIHDKIEKIKDYGGEVDILRNKYRFYEWCMENDIQTARLLMVFKEGVICQNNCDGGMSELPRKDLFSKNLEGTWGRWVCRWIYEDGKYWGRGESDKGFSGAELINHLKDVSQDGGVVLQERLTNGPFLQGLAVEGLCTVRIVTCRNGEGEVEGSFATLRMPTGDSDADNFHSGGIAAPVDLETGRLGRAVARYPGSVSPETDFHIVHPDTEQRIEGNSLPHWEEMLELVRGAHRQLKQIESVGWDVAITDDGPVLVEGNKRWGVTTLEIPHGRPLMSTAFPEYYRHWTGENLERQ